MNKFVIGIDPGKGGGIVTLTNGRVTTIDKMPQGPSNLWDFFIALGFPAMLDLDRTWVFQENVHAMPNDGKASIWSFAKHVGQLEMLSELLSMSPAYVTPQKWQKWLSAQSYGLTRDKMAKPQWKSVLAKNAKAHIGPKWDKKITLATADAYYIALYGWDLIKNEESNTKRSPTSYAKAPIR